MQTLKIYPNILLRAVTKKLSVCRKNSIYSKLAPFKFTTIPINFYSSGQDFMSEIDDIIDLNEKKLRGLLTICPTPIGNLRDMSIRQYETLLDSDIIACEDTRLTGLLFKLLKEKRIKEKFYEKFDINLAEIKDVTIDDFRENEDNEAFDKVFETAEQKERKKTLAKLDTLNFMGKEEINDEFEDSIYGLDDKFIMSMRKKINDVKEKKGRGLLISYFQHNEERRIPRLIKCLEFNFKIALVCDAGTPTISDPGFRLVDAAHKNRIRVTSLPGPTSPIVSLSLSGFPSDRYLFEGFLSKVESLKIEKLERVRDSESTAIFFESTERILKTLLTIEKIFGPNQMIFVSFELTKMHERYLRLPVQQVYETINNSEEYKHMKGEITFVIAPYLPAYNSDLRLETIKRNLGADNTYKVNIEEVASYLDKKLEASDKDLANILVDIFKIQKNKAMTCVSKVKEKTREKRTK